MQTDQKLSLWETVNTNKKCDLFDVSKPERHNYTKEEALDYLAQILVEAFLLQKRNDGSKQTK